MESEASGGRIVTFYSFKGGVGRTMALANVAYLAAYHQKRVLVMDWDLEAPGLLYYFRGLSNPDAMESAKHSCGILNILWDWHRQVTHAQDNDSMEQVLRDFEMGLPFRRCVHSITDQQAIAQSGELHYMGAGSPTIDIGEDVSYAQALSIFPWAAFYEHGAGGALINLWRRWAKANYDLILIDSRTGLADVAGLCTMQFPDEVTLCLVLNRQNIDGTGRVAASIRENRGDAIALRVAPMRVARTATSEESDARARAISVLTRLGGFSNDQVMRDFAQLSIAASENVPFYETLTPFSAADPMLDLLTLNYCKMASSLLGAEITAPVIDEVFRQQVRRRQGQDRRSATPDYVHQLITTEPARAVDELARLVDSAWASLHDDEHLSEAYVSALADAAMQIDPLDFEDELFSTRDTLIQLLRRLFTEEPDRWRSIYVSFLEWACNTGGLGDSANISELSLLDELDVALSNDWTATGLLRRVSYRRRTAWLTWSQTNDESLTRYLVDEVVSIANYILQNMSPTDEDRAECGVALADMTILRGDIALANKRSTEAISLYNQAEEQTSPLNGDWSIVRVEMRRLNAIANLRIVGRRDQVGPETAADHALRALGAQAAFLANAQRFVEFCNLFAQPTVSQSATFKFIQEYLDNPLDRTRRGPYAGTIGIRRPMLSSMLEALNALAIKASQTFQESSLQRIGAAASHILDSAKLRMPSGGGPTESINRAASALVQTLMASAKDKASQLPEIAAVVMSRATQIDARNVREAE